MLPPNLSKIFEKLVHLRLTIFWENSNKLFKFKFGFRNNTSHVLTSLAEQKINASDKNILVVSS